MRARTLIAGLVIVGATAGAYALMSPEGPPTDQPTWQHSYGSGNREEATQAAPTPDGGTVIAGDRSGPGGHGTEAWVMRLDAKGGTVWERAWDAGDVARVEDIAVASDGTFIVTGETRRTARVPSHIWAAKLDAQGHTVWQKAYDKHINGTAHSILPTADGGYVLAGAEKAPGAGSYDGWVAKIDAMGAVVWDRSYGGAQDDQIVAIRETPDNGYVFAGYTRSQGAGGDDAWVAKIDHIGRPLWQHTFGGPGDDRLLDIVDMGGEGFVAAGWSENRAERHRHDAWVLRLDRKGDKLWEHTYGGSQDDMAREIRPSNQGGFVVAGSTASATASGHTEPWLFRIASDGHLLWRRTLGGEAAGEATAVVPMLDGAYVVAGTERTGPVGADKAWVLRVNALGVLSGVD